MKFKNISVIIYQFINTINPRHLSIKFINDSLYKNSFFLLLSNALNIGCGFLFWIIAAKFYSLEDVGLATALISSMGLVILFSRFGFDVSLIRFFSTRDSAKVFSTSLIVTTVSTITVGFFLLLLIGLLAPSISFMQTTTNGLIFIFFSVVNSVALVTGNAFTAARRADHYFYQNILMALRIIILVPLVFLGSFGIFGSVGLTYLLASIFGLFLQRRFLSSFEMVIDKIYLKESLDFSMGNYISNILYSAPALIIPIVVFDTLGGAEAAKYYIAYSIAYVVLIIPTALSTSLMVEGSHGADLKKISVKTGFAVFVLLVPTVVFLYVFGPILLSLFKNEYVGAIELLRIFALSSFFVAIHMLFIPIQTVRMKIKSIVTLNLIRFVLMLGLSYILILRFGIIGAGYAWMITYGLIALLIVGLARRENWI
jgi:O-antigen/teichoic acid export membrane protein